MGYLQRVELLSAPYQTWSLYRMTCMSRMSSHVPSRQTSA